MSSTDVYSSVVYEVYGEVQGVFFRKFTQDTARNRRCVGWVSNTYHGTVKGVVQGRHADVQFMKQWLENTGSPMSKIESVKFSDEKTLSELEYKDFSVRH